MQQAAEHTGSAVLLLQRHFRSHRAQRGAVGRVASRHVRNVQVLADRSARFTEQDFARFGGLPR